MAQSQLAGVNSLNKVVQYRRRKRIHIALEPGRPTRDLRGGEEGNAPVNPRLNWTAAEWAVLEARLRFILASGKAVVPGGRPASERAIPRGPAQANRVSQRALIHKFSAGNPNGTRLRRGGPVPVEKNTRPVPRQERSSLEPLAADRHFGCV